MTTYKNQKLNEISNMVAEGQYLTAERNTCGTANVYVHNEEGEIINEYHVTMTHDEFVNFLGNDL